MNGDKPHKGYAVCICCKSPWWRHETDLSPTCYSCRGSLTGYPAGYIEWRRYYIDKIDKPATTTFPTGAVRSADVAGEAYHLIHPIALRRLAKRCHVGLKYERYNWEKGMPITDLADHVIAHLFKYLGGDRSDDHLAAALWGCHAMTVSEELWPELNTDLRPAVEPSK